MSEIQSLYQVFLKSAGVNTDTRTIKPGEIFFALKGEHFNGNTYAAKSIEDGALLAVIDEPQYAIEGKTMLVPNVLKALQDLSAHHRNQFKGKVIALTGSNGKTTSKELLYAALSSQYQVHATKGNLNNHIGVPLTLLGLKAHHELAIIEMGANHQKEIDSYCQWVRPDIGIITNIGKAHLEGFGGFQGVIKGKTELYRFIQTHGGVLWVNADDPLLENQSENISRVFYGKQNTLFSVEEIDASDLLQFRILHQGKSYTIHTQLTGAYNLSNTILAIFAGLQFNITIDKIIQHIEVYQPTNSRSQMIRQADYTLILDAYNANPSSMKVAIENLATFNPNTVAFLGGMKELGEESEAEHESIGSYLADQKIEEVVLVGKEFKHTSEKYGYRYFETSPEAAPFFNTLKKTGKTILLKGSRGTAMEKIIETL